MDVRVRRAPEPEAAERIGPQPPQPRDPRRSGGERAAMPVGGVDGAHDGGHPGGRREGGDELLAVAAAEARGPAGPCRRAQLRRRGASRPHASRTSAAARLRTRSSTARRRASTPSPVRAERAMTGTSPRPDGGQDAREVVRAPVRPGRRGGRPG